MSRAIVVIGNFDGVHRGHQAVVGAALDSARATGATALALTFHPHPQEVLGNTPRPVLTSLARKRILLERAGIGVVVEPFTLELAALSPEQFVERILVRKLDAESVLVGENFRFGKGRVGDLDELVRLGKRFGFSARAQALAGDEAGLFSSTRVRQALSAGDLAEAERCLGRPHSVAGTVQRGDGRGRTIGVPTANLSDIAEVLPPNGVYACLVDRQLGDDAAVALGLGVANIGVRPTAAAGFSVEVHLLDFDQDLYGARLRVHWGERLRSELKFPDLEALRAQIERDKDASRVALSGRKPEPGAGGGWA
ncbi:MAG: bifunctional riboflavin kinase/FAD synthetase [Myxococcota bacterium]|nr:bifunctional riboflavin kinase/FAD synthetase [Myxococcota bacterium]